MTSDETPIGGTYSGWNDNIIFKQHQFGFDRVTDFQQPITNDWLQPLNDLLSAISNETGANLRRLFAEVKALEVEDVGPLVAVVSEREEGRWELLDDAHQLTPVGAHGHTEVSLGGHILWSTQDGLGVSLQDPGDRWWICPHVPQQVGRFRHIRGALRQDPGLELAHLPDVH